MEAIEQLGLDTEHGQLLCHFYHSASRERLAILHGLHGSELVVPLLVLEAVVEVVKVQLDRLLPGLLVVQHLVSSLNELGYELLPQDDPQRLGQSRGIAVLQVVPSLRRGEELGNDGAKGLCREEQNPGGGLLED